MYLSCTAEVGFLIHCARLAKCRLAAGCSLHISSPRTKSSLLGAWSYRKKKTGDVVVLSSLNVMTPLFCSQVLDLKALSGAEVGD